MTAAVVGAALLGACGGQEAGQSAAADRPSSPAPERRHGPDDAAVCDAYGDVLTIVENADIALADGRMDAQEQHGWYGLATRVLGRLPGDGGSAVQTAVGALQEAAPAGTSAESTGVRSPAWVEAEQDLGTACDDAGAPLAITMFTGG